MIDGKDYIVCWQDGRMVVSCSCIWKHHHLDDVIISDSLKI